MTLILSTVFGWIVSQLLVFWPWVLGVSGSILAFLFSATIRKYTLSIIAIALILGVTFLGGYNSNHTITTVTHSCEEFSKHLTITTKGINVLKKNGLCQ